MKICPKCGAQLDDNATFCTVCGIALGGAPNPQQPQPQPQPMYQQPMPAYDPYDHTAEFDPKDISDNKVVAMLLYLLGAAGIVIALLMNNSSKYIAFHLRQALKFLAVETLLIIIGALLSFTIIVPIAAGVCFAIIFVLKIICFFQICKGKAKEPAIIRSLGFLK